MSFLEKADHATAWVLMSPGAALPVTKGVTGNPVWQNNPVIKAFGTLPQRLVNEFANVQVFGSVGEKNFAGMGDVTGSAVLSEMLNGVTVGRKDPQQSLAEGQKRIEALMQKR